MSISNNYITHKIESYTSIVETEPAADPNIIFFNNWGLDQKEMLRIAPDGFYIRGEKVPVDENEGLAVFKALKRFLTESALRSPY